MKAYNNGETHYNVYDSSGQLAHTERHLANGQVHTKTDYRAAGMRISRFLKIYDHLGDLAGYNTVYYHSDHLGSPVLATNVNGTERWRESYTPFGETLTSPADNDNQPGFTGHIKDSATGLNYMQARYYDPVIGRFLSIDPVTFMDTEEPDYFNRYSYSANDPINKIDPSGESWLHAAKFAYGAYVGGVAGAAGGGITGGKEGAKNGGLAGGLVGGLMSAGGVKSNMVISGSGSITGQLAGQVTNNLNTDAPTLSNLSINVPTTIGAIAGSGGAQGMVKDVSVKNGVVNDTIGGAIDGTFTGTGELLGDMGAHFIEENTDYATNISLTDKDGNIDIGLKRFDELEN